MKEGRRRDGVRMGRVRAYADRQTRQTEGNVDPFALLIRISELRLVVLPSGQTRNSGHFENKKETERDDCSR